MKKYLNQNYPKLKTVLVHWSVYTCTYISILSYVYAHMLNAVWKSEFPEPLI